MTFLLCDWEIENAIEKEELVIKPYDKRLINPNSIDLRLGDHFITYLKSDDVINPFDGASIDKSIKESMYVTTITINPGDFVLGRTLEEIRLPDFYAARIEGKSSLARLGLTIHQTGGWIDSGFHGTITLEINNVNKRPIVLHKNMPICQMSVFLTNPPRTPYNKRKNSKYAGQIAPTISKYWGNSEWINNQ